ncbi:hypothetical protein MNBD_ALPHA02-487 [hydrothermal vent metagenome]|uniref:Porin domain-containing protein n=1 Tax=hydrothermal vent metagenome TaxID=652676 RepID=A0A3B0RYM3_9ZZZZ
MTSLKGSIALMGTIGIFAMTSVAYGAPDSEKNDGAEVAKSGESLTSSVLSFFGGTPDIKDVGPEVILLEKPAKENADQYITLSETPAKLTAEKPDKKIFVKQSFDVAPALIFNMGNSGIARPAGIAAGQQITFSYGPANHGRDPRALGISIGSQFLIEPSSVMSPLFDGSEFDQIKNRQVYNLSVGMGFAGFRLGASFSREKMLNDAGLKGYDIGLGYTGNKWGADVKFGGYRRDHNLLFASREEFYNTVQALEIGAAYQLYSNIRFTGRFTYYSYGQENELDKLKSSQVFFLGTNVNF